jgi:hypothetical protein
VALVPHRRRADKPDRNQLVDDHDVVPVGHLGFDLSVWVLVNLEAFQKSGVPAAIPTFESSDGVEFVPIYTDEATAGEAVEKNPGYAPMELSEPGSVTGVLEYFEAKGVGYVGFDVGFVGRRYGMFPIGDVIDYVHAKYGMS